MEEILGFFGFSLGASLAIGAVRTVTDGSRPVVRELFKSGIRAWDAISNTSANVRAEVADERATSATRRPGRRRAAPEKIVIARQ